MTSTWMLIKTAIRGGPFSNFLNGEHRAGYPAYYDCYMELKTYDWHPYLPFHTTDDQVMSFSCCAIDLEDHTNLLFVLCIHVMGGGWEKISLGLGPRYFFTKMATIPFARRPLNRGLSFT